MVSYLYSVLTVAMRFASEYGCKRVSIGEALRLITEKFPNSKLTELILSHLKNGETVPDDLCVHALERALLDVQCMTRGYVVYTITREYFSIFFHAGYTVHVCMSNINSIVSVVCCKNLCTYLSFHGQVHVVHLCTTTFDCVAGVV